MNEIIKTALLVPKSFELPKKLNEKLSVNDIGLHLFNDVIDLKNAGYFDVILIEEGYLIKIDKDTFPNSILIIIYTSTSDISKIYDFSKKLSAFSILPISLESVVVTIKNAFKNHIKNKQKENKISNGKLVYFTSFNNGVGKSFISYNFANQICAFFKDKSVCLIDANYPVSTGKSLINIDAGFTWENIKPLLTEKSLDQEKLASVLLSTDYKFLYLSGPVSFVDNNRLSKPEMETLSDVVAKSFKVGIFDLPTISTKEDFELLNKADIICIIVKLNSTSIYNTKKGIDILMKNYPSVLEKTIFVINQIDKNYGLTPKIFANQFGIEPFAAIDKDDEAVMTYEQKGKLLDNPQLLLTHQIKGLAEKIMAKFF